MYFTIQYTHCVCSLSSLKAFFALNRNVTLLLYIQLFGVNGSLMVILVIQSHNSFCFHNQEKQMALFLSSGLTFIGFYHELCIDLNRLRRYRALEFRQPVIQGKHSVKRSLYKALHRRLSLVLRRWRPARTISYRPFLKHQRFAVPKKTLML